MQRFAEVDVAGSTIVFTSLHKSFTEFVLTIGAISQFGNYSWGNCNKTAGIREHKQDDNDPINATF